MLQRTLVAICNGLDSGPHAVAVTVSICNGLVPQLSPGHSHASHVHIEHMQCRRSHPPRLTCTKACFSLLTSRMTVSPSCTRRPWSGAAATACGAAAASASGGAASACAAAGGAVLARAGASAAAVSAALSAAALSATICVSDSDGCGSGAWPGGAAAGSDMARPASVSINCRPDAKSEAEGVEYLLLSSRAARPCSRCTQAGVRWERGCADWRRISCLTWHSIVMNCNTLMRPANTRGPVL